MLASNEDFVMPTYTIRTNFLLTDRAREIIDAFIPRRIPTHESEPLPYLAWAYGVRQMDGAKVIKQSGPGYILGAIERSKINDGIVIALDDKRHFAVALRDSYDERLIYTVDCVDRQFTIVATR